MDKRKLTWVCFAASLAVSAAALGYLLLHFGLFAGAGDYTKAKECYLKSGMPWQYTDLVESHNVSYYVKQAELNSTLERIDKLHKVFDSIDYEAVSVQSARKYLAATEAVEKLIRQIPSSQEFSTISDPASAEHLHTSLEVEGRARRVVRLVACRGEWKIALGRFDEGIEDLRRAYSISRGLANGYSFYNVTYAAAASRSVDTSVARAASFAMSKPARLADLQRIVARHQELWSSPANVLKGQAVATLSYSANVDLLREYAAKHEGGFLGNMISNRRHGDPVGPARRAIASRFLKLWAKVGEAKAVHPDSFESWLTAYELALGEMKDEGGLAVDVAEMYLPNGASISSILQRQRIGSAVLIAALKAAQLRESERSRLKDKVELLEDELAGETLNMTVQPGGVKVWSSGLNGVSESDGDSPSSSDDIVVALPWKPKSRHHSSGLAGVESVR